jgi:diguanylate cyclase (GGDEF)-like protein/PAS domain S-box-containing protein
VNDAVPAALLAAPRILVIDDNRAIHQDFRKIFGAGRRRATPSAAELALLGGGRSAGAPEFQVDSAYQGEEGLALVRLAQDEERPYAMAFVDVRMPPGWDGVETTAQIWQHDPDIQIVICTAFSDYSWSEMLAKLGRSDRLVILKKPFDTIEVVQLASALTEKWRLARESRSILQDLERRVAERTRELVQSVEELRRSESVKGAILESSLDCVVTIDHEGKIVEFNPAAEATFGLARELALGREMVELIVPPRLREAHRRGFAHYLATGSGPILGKRLELQAIRADGSEFPIELAINALRATSQPMFTGFIRDITARKEADEKIRRLNRVYAVLSQINMLIVRVRDRGELFREACRIAIEAGGFRMAWIGLADKEAGIVRPAASAGEVGNFFETAPLAITETKPGGHGLAGRAMREKTPVISNDVQGDPQRMMKRELAERGIRSLVIMPLIVGNQAIGVLALYAAEIGVFDQDEMRLLLELAGDIAFAVEHIDEAGKLERMTRMNAMLSGINGAIVRIRDRQELFEEACRIAVETGGLAFAWLCVVDEAEERLRPLAFAGPDDGFLEMIGGRFSLRDDAPEGHGIGARAVRDRCALVVNDIQAADLKYKKAHADRGIESAAALPLFIAGRIVGAFGLHAPEVDFFDADEMKLLNEVAANIAFALEHIEKEEKVRRLTRVYAVLSGINALIVRARDRDELFKEACRIAVQSGQFALAWVAVADPRDQMLKAAAWAGDERGFVQLTRPSGQAKAQGKAGLSAQAMETRLPVVCNDIAADGSAMRYAKEALERGYRSAAALPLVVGGTPIGALVLYAAEAGFFDDEEMRLLQELAGDIAFALEHIAGQQKLENLSRIRAVSSHINAAIIRIREREALLRETCRIALEHGKFELVWIAALDHEEKKVQPIAWNGFSPDAVHAVNWASMTAARGTLGEAMLTGKPAVRNDIEVDLPMGRLRQEAVKKGCLSTICLPLMVDGTVVALLALFAPGAGFFDEQELTLLNEVAADVSFALQAIEKQEELEYLSYYDALTGLANRKLFLERVSQYMRSAVGSGHKLAVFFADLERFRNINDSLGRPAGDALLKQVAEWLTRKVGDASLVARMGADHFAVVLPQVKAQGNVAGLVEKAAAAFIEHPFHLNEAVFRIALKIGVAVFPDDGADADTLLKNAEAALKKAKARGERYLFYDAKMTDTVAGKLTLENQLRLALDREEFVLHYQPKVSLASGKLTSAEALIRWNDPQSGLVPPGRFIPVLEETGLIYDVGRWALRKAIEDYLRWRAAGRAAVRIAVNVSPMQLRNRGFVGEIQQAIGIDAHAAAGLELEITESLIMEDVKHNIASLQAIREMGVRIAIDDFGTGFSSLSYLAKLPVHTLKIDRSFVIDMTVAPEGLALVSTIINLAHSLKLKVVAEGVETEQQSRLLRLLGCDEMQGYLFSRPLPGEVFEAKFLAGAVAVVA